MKILLVYPYSLEKRVDEDDIRTMPMGLYYIGAMLKSHGFDVEVLNAYDLNASPGLIEDHLVRSKPDIIGFSILHANRWGGIEIARKARELFPRVKTVFGGVGATFLWEHLLTHFKSIDYCVLGEGEHTFLELVRFIMDSRKRSADDIRGIAYRKNNMPVKTGPRQLAADLDQLPMPAKYFNFQHLSLSRGCPSDCTFCGSPMFWGKKVRFHSADYFVDQVKILNRRGVSFFYVSDDTFTLKKSLVIQICKRIVKSGLKITWAAISRVDCISREMLVWMRKAGCIQISYGVESGSEKIRSLFNKRITTQKILDAFSVTQGCGIMARAYFIYGAPGETAETIGESLDLIQRIKPLGAIFYILDLFPGTRLYADYISGTGVSDDIWLEKVEDILYFETDPHLTKENVLSFGKMLRQGYFKGICEYAENIALMDQKELYPYHADFLSRLALTFSHGDYANNPMIERPMETAMALNKRALTYFPDHRAYWGLGMIYHHMGRFEAAIDLLLKGAGHFPESADLHKSLASSLMKKEKFEQAMDCLLKFDNDPKALEQMIFCCRALKKFEMEKQLMKKYTAVAAALRP